MTRQNDYKMIFFFPQPSNTTLYSELHTQTSILQHGIRKDRVVERNRQQRKLVLPNSTTSTEFEVQRIEEASCDKGDTLEARRLIRKIDIRLLPICAAIYAFALIDRAS